jgi:hypothetical protein
MHSLVTSAIRGNKRSAYETLAACLTNFRTQKNVTLCYLVRTKIPAISACFLVRFIAVQQSCIWAWRYIEAGIRSNFHIYVPPASTPVTINFIQDVIRRLEACVFVWCSCVYFTTLYTIFRVVLCFKDLGRRNCKTVRRFSEMVASVVVTL